MRRGAQGALVVCTAHRVVVIVGERGGGGGRRARTLLARQGGELVGWLWSQTGMSDMSPCWGHTPCDDAAVRARSVTSSHWWGIVTRVWAAVTAYPHSQCHGDKTGAGDARCYFFFLPSFVNVSQCAATRWGP